MPAAERLALREGAVLAAERLALREGAVEEMPVVLEGGMAEDWVLREGRGILQL